MPNTIGTAGVPLHIGQGFLGIQASEDKVQLVRVQSA